MTETPKYEVIDQQNDIEIRRYPGYIKAEAVVEGRNYKTAIERGFNILAGYIFGDNIARQKIDMTTPVQAQQAEKIAMTTPVTVTLTDKYVVAFIMPAKYLLETLPVPNNQNIRFSEVPEHTVAAIRFTGYFNQEKINKNKAQLARWLAEQGLEVKGDYYLAGYNPPWVPGFLTRNEVMVAIKYDNKSTAG